MGKLITRNFPNSINGDNIVAFTDAKTFKQNFAEQDFASLGSWYAEDPDHNHLGLINLFGNITHHPKPMWMSMLKSNAIINVDGVNGRFTYDTPVAASTETVTTEDTSKVCGEKPGIDDSVFEIVLNAEFRQNDILSYDFLNGCDIIISADIRPRKEGDSWRYWVKLVANDKVKFFPKDKLRPGIRYWKKGNALGEFSTQYSGFTGLSKAGTMRSEFVLGGLRGVETSITRFAGEKSLRNADKYTSYFIEEALRQIRGMSDINAGFKPNLTIIGTKATNNGRSGITNAKIASTMEVFALAELAKMEAYQLMFQQGGIVTDNNSVIRINEGLYHQIRRGRRITYTRPNGLRREHIMEAANYVFQARPNLPVTQRYMKFKAGRMAYNQMMELFRDEFFTQLNRLGFLLGSDGVIKQGSLIEGFPDNITLKGIQIGSVFLPGIGNVEVEHEPSLDYVDFVDRSSLMDMHTPISSWSMIMEDVTNREYSNGFENIPNTTDVKIGDINNNVFYVKPEGPSMYWGYEHGRYSSTTTTGEVIASSSIGTTMAEQFWCNSASAVWVKDNSRFLLIERVA